MATLDGAAALVGAVGGAYVAWRGAGVGAAKVREVRAARRVKEREDETTRRLDMAKFVEQQAQDWMQRQAEAIKQRDARIEALEKEADERDKRLDRLEEKLRENEEARRKAEEARDTAERLLAQARAQHADDQQRMDSLEAVLARQAQEITVQASTIDHLRGQLGAR